jgi:hypothetical protein
MKSILSREMVASYEVMITGIQRTKRELAKLDGAISRLRKANYNPGGASPSERTLTGGGRSGDIFESIMDDLEGRVQAAARDAMAAAMALGKRTQAEVLRAEVTRKGLSGKPKGRRGPGREVTGAMIDSVKTNVEIQKFNNATQIIGWHGWSDDNRGGGGRSRGYFEFQEKGTRGRGAGSPSATAIPLRGTRGRKRAGSGSGVPAANSLGQSIIPVREFLKAELGKLK